MTKRTLGITLAAIVVAIGVVAVGVFALGSLKDTETPPAPALAASASFTPYTAEKLASVSETDTVVLFFHATWCPTCKQLADDITANIDEIPGDVRIFLVDYDTSTALKQKYGVTLQHTLVQVDRAGNEKGRWTGTPTLDEVLRQLS